MHSHHHFPLTRHDEDKLRKFKVDIASPEYRANLSSNDFNAVSDMLSLASMILCDEQGLTLLEKQPELIAMINSDSLNAELPFQYGKPVLSQLCSTINGINVLASSEHLLANIRSDAFNRSGFSKNSKMYYRSAAELLLHRTAGQQLLLDFPQVRNVIGESELAKCIFDLVRYGREFLMHAPDLCERISAQSLNDVHDVTLYPGYSVLTWLCCNEEGQKILFANPSLIDKISAQAFNRPVQNNQKVTNGTMLPDGITPVFGLVATEGGRDFLVQHDKLRRMINPTTLPQTVNGGSFIKSTMLDLLCQPESSELRHVLGAENHAYEHAFSKNQVALSSRAKFSASARRFFSVSNRQKTDKPEDISRGLRK